MIDIHTHIIYGIDDGAKDFDESIEMIRMAADTGTRKMIATSHYMQDTFPYELDEYFRKLDELNAYCLEHRIPMTIYKGHELFLSPENIKDVETGKVNTLGDTDYILVEVSSFMNVDKAEELMDILSNNGKKIIIAHVERLDIVLSDFNTIQRWYDKGYAFQINKSSILRKDYKENYLSAHRLLAKGMVHIIASDGHRHNKRRPLLDEVHDYLVKTLGQDGANLLLKKNPDYLLQGHQMVGLHETIYNKKYRLRRVLLKLKGDY